MTKLLYIGGYGRSGSTLLEVLLAARPAIIACGEVVIASRRQDAPRCSCGKAREDCALWGTLIDEDQPSGSWDHKALTLALLDEVKERYDFLVDSSKTAWGSLRTPFAFRRALRDDFRLLHIVRDPRGVCWSNVGGKRRRHGKRLPDIQRSPKRFVRHVRTLLGWWAANLACEMFGWRYPDQYVRIRYEALVEAPEETLARIFGILRLGQSPALEGSEISGNRHQLFGSRVRFRALSRANIRQDVRWTEEMHLTDRRMISILSWPLRSRYGY